MNRVIFLILLLVLCSFHLVRAVTVKITGGPAIVTISKIDWLRTDGKEVEIYVSEGTISIISKAIIPISIGR
jgi:DNA-binding LytR/AlgR family response regulator